MLLNKMNQTISKDTPQHKHCGIIPGELKDQAKQALQSKRFNGLAWLFLSVPKGSSLLYKETGVWEDEQETPSNFRDDYAVSR
ncbi:hypothetical protein ACJW30_04G050000 [Castanea mollissima]